MKSPVKITAYRCPHHRMGCRRHPYITIRAAESHAEKCIFNEENRTCATCAHDLGGEDGGCAKGVRPAGTPLASNCPSWVHADEGGQA